MPLQQHHLPLLVNSTVRDSDFNLSVSDVTGVNVSATQTEIRKGDALYSDCKGAFLDL